MNDVVLDKFIGKKVIEINEMHPIVVFEEYGMLTIECSWRLRNNKTIKLIPPVSDLISSLENGLYLELFSDSNIYESWTLSDGKGFDIISATAGRCCIFNK